MRWFWLALLLCQVPAHAEVRIWTDNTGKYRVFADYGGFANGQVALRKENGQTILVPLNRLSDEDQKLVQSLSSGILGQVVGVTDGDTITVLDDDKEQHKIRLEGIDAPESDQPYGSRAKQALSDKVFGKRVRVEWKERDRYKRILGIVYVDDRVINKEMVQEGWALHYTQYSDDEDLAKAESDAREARGGQWAGGNVIAPWDWRRGVRPKVAEQPVVEQPRFETPAQPPVQSVTVYRTKTGAKYHRAGCRYLSKSSIPISLSEAKGRYGPCSVCNPPK